jgi:hypothetical protein
MIPEQTLLNFPLFGDNATKVEPDNNKKSNGWQQADVVPAEWMNWEWYHASKGISDLNQGVKSIEAELNSILSEFAITPSVSLNNQLLSALNKMYPQIANCSTSASTQTKTVTIAGTVLKPGSVFIINMINGNLYGDGVNTYPLLKINNNTAFPICDAEGSFLGEYDWIAGNIITLTFIGDKFISNFRRRQKNFDIMYPTGSVYVQYPLQLAPADLFNINGIKSTWGVINYNGRFFRANGGNAGAFNEPNDTLVSQGQATAINGLSVKETSNLSGEMKSLVTKTAPERSGIINYGTNEQFVYISGSTTYNLRPIVINANHGHVLETTDTETRPDNYTIKVWKRTA